jgi:hypothetical protein
MGFEWSVSEEFWVTGIELINQSGDLDRKAV